MATLEMTLEEVVEEASSPDRFESAPQKFDGPVCEPWKQGSDPERAIDFDWLFDVLMI
jgi:hypothetical protein